jgi:endonuclease III
MNMSTWPKTRSGALLAKLERAHGNLSAPQLDGPLEMILWEIVAYLADDAQRALAFEALRTRVGLTPAEILKAPLKVLAEITRMGGSIAYGERAERLQTAARLALEEFGGDVASVLELPPQKAKKLLMRFPMIGEPGAEKILLFCGALDVLALESNGLRTLVRIGIGEDRKSYAATYKSVREVTLEELPSDSKTLMQAHLLLRKHGQEVCLRNGPLCGACAASADCRHFQSGG